MVGIKGTVYTKLTNATNRMYCEVEYKEDEDEQCGHLNGKTSDHDIVAKFRVLTILRFDGGDTSTN
jgi:hypothetical protein